MNYLVIFKIKKIFLASDKSWTDQLSFIDTSNLVLLCIKIKSLKFSAVSQGIIFAPIFKCFSMSVSSLLENPQVYFCFQEAISFYTEMMDLGISPLKGNNYR